MKQTMTLVLLTAVAAFCLGIFARDGARVSAAEINGLQGRYQITNCQFHFTDKNGEDGRAEAPFLVDSVTGRVWMYTGPDAQVLQSPHASAAGLGGFDSVPFNGPFTKDKNDDLVAHRSNTPQ